MRSLLWVAAIWGPLVVFLVRKEHDRDVQRLQVSIVLALLATFSMAIASAEEITRDPVIIERVTRGALCALALMLAVPALTRQAPSLLVRRLPGTTAILLYALVVAASTLYSVAPGVTGPKAFELATGIVAAIAIVTRPDSRAVIESTIRLVIALSGALVAVAVVGFFLLPDTFAFAEARPGFLIRNTLTSPYAHPNSLSFFGSVLAGFCLAMMLKGDTSTPRKVQASGVVLGLAGVVLSSGRQGLVILIISVAFVLFALRRRFLSYWAIPTALFLVALYGGEMLDAFSRGQSQSNLVTLSGRTVWWASSVEAWAEHPWLGFGFGAGGRFIALSRIGFENVSSVHSGYLELLLGVGLIGMIPFGYAIWRSIRFTARFLTTYTEFAMLTIPLVVHTTVSLGIGGWLSPSVVIFVLLVGLSDTLTGRWLGVRAGQPHVAADSKTME